MLLALAVYIPLEILIWFGLCLDEILFPAYRKIDIREPVFIIGNPRSGTTFLQRLMARDNQNFEVIRTWEIFLSPSITTRKLIWLLVKTGREIGVPIVRRILRLEKLWKDSDKIHRLRLRAPEEDEYLFIHNFSTMKIWSYAALEEEAQPFIYYDQAIPVDDKNRMMTYYQRCIQRHFFSHGQPDRKYLSKNPNFSPAIQTLTERFPDAKFIYLIRNPLDAVPSHISLKDREWRMLGSPIKKYACADFIIQSSRHWYNYPIEIIRGLPADQGIIVRFEDLVKEADKTINDIYQKFGLKMSDEFQNILEIESAQARQHESKHLYDLDEMGITETEMINDFGDLIKEFDFPIEDYQGAGE